MLNLNLVAIIVVIYHTSRAYEFVFGIRISSKFVGKGDLVSVVAVVLGKFSFTMGALRSNMVGLPTVVAYDGFPVDSIGKVSGFALFKACFPSHFTILFMLLPLFKPFTALPRASLVKDWSLADCSSMEKKHFSMSSKVNIILPCSRSRR